MFKFAEYKQQKNIKINIKKHQTTKNTKQHQKHQTKKSLRIIGRLNIIIKIMSKTLLTAFNNTLIKFINELISTYPQEGTFTVLKTTISLMKRINPRKVLKIFIKNIDPFREHLMSRNEEFFLNDNYSSIVNDTDNKQDAWKLIDKLKLYWKDTNKNNKDIIWDYFNVLLTISDRLQ